MSAYRKNAVYIGCKAPGASVTVFGDMFGASMVAINATLEDSLSEFDERFGERVGSISPEEFEQGMNDGDIRVNDGGTIVHVDPYEWMREYPSLAVALKAHPELRGWETAHA